MDARLASRRSRDVDRGGQPLATQIGHRTQVQRQDLKPPIEKGETFMVRDRLINLLLGITLIGAIAPSAFAVEIDPLRAVPGNCNAVAVVQMRRLVNSPLGKREKWFDKARHAYAEGLLSGPPWVKEIVQATTVGSATKVAPLTYSLYVMDRPSIIDDIAKHELAPLEKIAGHGAVVSPRNVCFIQLAPGLVGAVQPANRQAALDWATSLDDKQVARLAPGILDALGTDESSQVSLVIDLKGLLKERYVLNWIVGTPKLRATDDVEGLAKVLSSLKMAHLSVQVTQAIVAHLRLDFDSPIDKHAAGLEKAVIQWLDDAGARPHALAAAKTTVGEKTLTFEVPLDEVGLRRLLSLIQSPHIAPEEVRSGENRTPNALASAAYYEKVCDLLNALLYKNQDATEYAKTAHWHEQFARRITALSTTAVDPALVRWGRDVSKELRALASSLRGEAVKLDELERSIRTDETVTYQEYGYNPLSGPLYAPLWVSTVDNVDQVRSQQDSQVEKSAGQRDQIWNMLYQETADVARKMESTYHIKLKMPQ
jgi:hypothetical protein